MHIAPHQESLEIKKHINRVLARIPVLDLEEAVQREFRHQSVTLTMNFFQAIDRARRYRHIDRNLRGQLRRGRSRQPDLRRPQLYPQESLLQINGLYRFEEKEIDGHPGIGLSQYLG